MSRISTDIPDPLLPPLPIVHCIWQVLRATSSICTELLYVCLSWMTCEGVHRVHHLRAHPYFSSSVLHVWFVWFWLFSWLVVGGRTVDVLWGENIYIYIMENQFIFIIKKTVNFYAKKKRLPEAINLNQHFYIFLTNQYFWIGCCFIFDLYRCKL